MIIRTRRCVANKNHVTKLSQRSRSQFTLNLCVLTSFKPVRVQPIFLGMVVFENNLAQMIIMIRQCVKNKNHITRLKVKVTLSS